jgi:hypothetical protein
MYAPVMAFAFFIGAGAGSSGLIGGAAGLVIWPVIYRFGLGPYYSRVARDRADEEGRAIDR